MIDYSKVVPKEEKCRGCGSIEFRHCEKGLVCSYCRVVINPARKPGAYVHMPYVTINAPTLPDPDKDKRITLTMAQATAKFRALGRLL